MTVTAHRRGLFAEWAARLYLRLKGYRIQESRYKTPLGEIDLIAIRNRTVVFVEVKWRGDIDTGLLSVSGKSQDRIRRAAMLYLQRHPSYAEYAYRFDVLVLVPCAWPHHVTNAW